MALVEIRGLGYTYGTGRGGRALQHCTLDIEPGESVLLVGPSGSGKSTLLRAIAGLVPHFHGGTIEGAVRVGGRDTRTTAPAELAGTVGFVFQDPEAQSVMSTVDAEVAFGLENLGVDPSEIELRTQEAMAAMGVSKLTGRRTHGISTGELQRTVIAAVLALQPQVLLLDEPTSQLDPLAAETLFAMVRRMNEETGLAVVVAEHRLDRCYGWADRVVVMERGRIACDGKPREAARWSLGIPSPYVPPVARIFAPNGKSGAPWDDVGFAGDQPPLTVKEGRAALAQIAGLEGSLAPAVAAKAPKAAAPQAPHRSDPAIPAVEVRRLTHVYADGTEAVSDVDLTIRSGEFVALMGENGAGKSTLVRHFNGLARPTAGTVSLFGDIVGDTSTERLAAVCGLLGHCPDDYITHDTVREEVLFTLENLRLGSQATSAGRSGNGCAQDQGQPSEAALDESPVDRSPVDALLTELELSELSDADPRSLSSGERQRVALASVLVGGPRILVLDEPTRGMDPELKGRLGELLETLRARGMTVILVTHDVEFASAYAHRVVVMAHGRIIADGPTREIMSHALLLSPQANRVMRQIAPGTMTVEEASAVLHSIVEGRAGSIEAGAS